MQVLLLSIITSNMATMFTNENNDNIAKDSGSTQQFAMCMMQELSASSIVIDISPQGPGSDHPTVVTGVIDRAGNFRVLHRINEAGPATQRFGNDSVTPAVKAWGPPTHSRSRLRDLTLPQSDGYCCSYKTGGKGFYRLREGQKSSDLVFGSWKGLVEFTTWYENFGPISPFFPVLTLIFDALRDYLDRESSVLCVSEHPREDLDTPPETPSSCMPKGESKVRAHRLTQDQGQGQGHSESLESQYRYHQFQAHGTCLRVVQEKYS
ncbi:hypothetical protein FANTH_12648 [Fusarium anthophilum]|uniref:Uncharacterized protein n=1 Tax=Fusarium anthophilum TaxID=48485 RepID=A0A8H4YRS2_9HYPO|nr:hypothetical protein FANTH_12648 [Fusarium anthophilum]